MYNIYIFYVCIGSLIGESIVSSSKLYLSATKNLTVSKVSVDEIK